MSTHDERIYSILKECAGYITATQATEAGIPRRCLTEMCAAGQLCKVDRGIYATSDILEDEMYSLQYRYGKGVFSHGTALYLHSMTDRTPHRYTLTFPRGYNTSGIRKHGYIKMVTSEFYELGITEMLSPYGNSLKVYEVERTLCDIVRGKNADDIQLVNPAMKAYLSSSNKDISKLLAYADRMRVKSKILNYIQILL